MIVADRPGPGEDHGIADVVLLHYVLKGCEQVDLVLEPQHDDALKLAFHGVGVGYLVTVGPGILFGRRRLGHDGLGDLRH